MVVGDEMVQERFLGTLPQWIKNGLQLGTGSPESTFHIRRRFHTGCVESSILASLSEAGGNGA
jgi:hypothetical protein